MHWLYLLFSIALEVSGTILLKLSAGFSKLNYALAALILYFLSFTILSFALKKIEVGVAYAIWSGIGTALIAIIGIVFFKEALTTAKIVFMSLIIIGAIGLNLSSLGH